LGSAAIEAEVFAGSAAVLAMEATQRAGKPSLADAIRWLRSTPLTEPAFDQLLRRLTEAEVELVLVGGLAVNAWGVVRGTKDVDIVVASDLENLKRVAGVAVVVHSHIQTGESFLSTPPSITAQLASGERVAIETTSRTSMRRAISSTMGHPAPIAQLDRATPS
jgi:hypothetical protein